MDLSQKPFLTFGCSGVLDATALQLFESQIATVATEFAVDQYRWKKVNFT